MYTNAARGAFTSRGISKISPLLSVAMHLSFSDAKGTRSENSLRSISTPASVVDEQHTTGVILPSFIALWIPSTSSFCVNCSPEKNFSNIASSVSATASEIAFIRPSRR